MWIAVLASSVFFLCVRDADAEGKLIRLRNETITTGLAAKSIRAQSAQPAETPVTGLYLVQFTERFQPTWRDQLLAMRVKLVRYVPDDAFVARLDRVRLSQVKSLPFVHWIGEYRVDHKVHSIVRAALLREGKNETTAVSVLLSPEATPAERASVRRALNNVRFGSSSRFGMVLRGNLAASALRAVAQSPAVLWIEPAPMMKLLDEVASKIVAGGSLDLGTADHRTAMQQLGFDGRGVSVAVADTGLNNGDAATMHPDLAGRVDAFLFYGNLTDAADEHSHGTHVTGIIAGDGATGEVDDGGAGGFNFNFDFGGDNGGLGTPTREPAFYGLGVAPKAHIVAQRIFDGAGNFEAPATNETLTRDATRAGAVIGSNSWGDDVQGRYDISAAEFDALVRDADAQKFGDQPYLLEFSAGNAGPAAQTIDSPAVAKNVIATGASQNNRLEFFLYADGQEAMADFSSRGPCEDGRIKPDVVAPGTWIASLQSASATDQNAWLPIDNYYQYQGGTSQSGPHASGAAAVFIQFYRETHAGTTPSPALVKAALINSAVDMDNSFGTEPVPNNDEGWGRVDLTEIIGSPRRYEYVDQSVLLTMGQIYERRVVVAGADEPLKITLVYTDVPGFPAAIPALVNDLDLEVIGPDGALYRGNQFDAGESVPNAAAGDHLNNVEAVHLNVPMPGEYLVRVRAQNVAMDARTDTPAVDQDFALVNSGKLALPGEGVMIVDRPAYTVPDVIRLRVIDFDLAGQPSVTVRLTSSTETNGEAIVLPAMGTAGVFTGSVAVVAGPAVADGRLQVSQGDTIQAAYQDAAPAATRIATARADLRPPVFVGNVSVTNRFGRTVIAWQTDEPANAVVRYGTNTALSASVTNRFFDSAHEIALQNLVPGTRYFFLVASADEAGNASTNNNNGALFSFVAISAPPILLVTAPDPFLDVPVSSYTSALDQIGLQYDLWEISQLGLPSTNDFRPYRVVIYRVAEFDQNGLPAAQENALQAYLNGGGALFIASMEILSRIGDVPFRRNGLHVDTFDEDATVPAIAGVDNDQITSGLEVDLDYTDFDIFGGLLDPDLSDTFKPTTNAVPILFEPTSGKAAGLRYPRTGEDSAGRVVFLSFPLETVPTTGPAPNNRANLLRNILAFLAPGLDGVGSIAFDNSEYTVPSRVVVEVADSDLAGRREITINFFSSTATNIHPVKLTESALPGLFRGTIALAAPTNAPGAETLPAKHGDTIWAEYFDVSANSIIRAVATVDTKPPAITNIAVVPEYSEATVTWETSEPADGLVEFGESTFLGRSAYAAERGSDHEVTLEGLLPDRVYYYRVTSRDVAGNIATDDNRGNFYTFRTLPPLLPPWVDNLESSGTSTNWAVIDGEAGTTTWQLGAPLGGLIPAHSGKNVWGSNLNGDSIDLGDTFLVSPAVQLVGGNKATLKFSHNYDFTLPLEFDIYHFGQVYVSTNGRAWDLLDEYTDIDSGGNWEEVQLDLSAYLGTVVRLGWYYGLFAFESFPRLGWLLDDVSITMSSFVPGTVLITNNLAQSSFTLSGPISRTGQGLSLLVTNAASGDYAITFGDVPYYQKPASQTNHLAANGLLIFQGNYTFPDTNTNGISDLWETNFFGTVSPTRTAFTDTDHDGLTDLAEFIAGTNPTNADSRLELRMPLLLNNGNLRIDWTSTPGHAYRVEGSPNAVTWVPLTDWIRASVNVTSFTGPSSTNTGNSFFRLSVKP